MWSTVILRVQQRRRSTWMAVCESQLQLFTWHECYSPATRKAYLCPFTFFPCDGDLTPSFAAVYRVDFKFCNTYSFSISTERWNVCHFCLEFQRVFCCRIIFVRIFVVHGSSILTFNQSYFSLYSIPSCKPLGPSSWHHSSNNAADLTCHYSIVSCSQLKLGSKIIIDQHRCKQEHCKRKLIRVRL